jgi:hypothetical protein
VDSPFAPFQQSQFHSFHSSRNRNTAATAPTRTIRRWKPPGRCFCWNPGSPTGPSPSSRAPSSTWRIPGCSAPCSTSVLRMPFVSRRRRAPGTLRGEVDRAAGHQRRGESGVRSQGGREVATCRWRDHLPRAKRFSSAERIPDYARGRAHLTARLRLHLAEAGGWRWICEQKAEHQLPADARRSDVADALQAVRG